jgi:hypothetical protein
VDCCAVNFSLKLAIHDLKRRRIKRLGISYDRIATDDWESFLSAFGEDIHEAGKNTR